jgi:hypothetical protein
MPISFGFDPAKHAHEIGSLGWAREHHADFQGLPVQPEYDATGLGYPVHDGVNLNDDLAPEQLEALARYRLTDEATFDSYSGGILPLGGDEPTFADLRALHNDKVIQGMEDYSD